ncbi:unnamed protein product [Echinostoma caproni]|uniref:WD_REPEATS_REGION domain-containing protein n=1 Tax=Echinostoma caproni TaxID=27848 RepID=A0A183B3J3_9TREM|nr:unnamed protein product [Echinostoma caproni]
MGEPRRSVRSSAKACLKALSGIAKQLESEDDIDKDGSDGSSAGFQPSQSSSSESESSLSEESTEGTQSPTMPDEPSDSSVSSIKGMRSSGQENETYLSAAMQRSINNKLLFVGGLVQALSWSPSRTSPDASHSMDSCGATVDTVYLAISTLPSPDTRIFYTDSFTTHSGLIQVWDCGKICLKSPPADWAPTPHLFIAHNWGHVLDLCWLPMSVILVHSRRTPPVDQFPPGEVRILFDPFPQINRVGGHLIAACQDGIVRVFAVSRLKLDQVHFMNRGKLPLYTLKEGMSVNLSISPDGKFAQTRI